MFKTIFLVVDEEWGLITQYKSNIKPDVGEFLFLESKYFKVLNIIHTFKTQPNGKNITVVVKEWESFIRV